MTHAEFIVALGGPTRVARSISRRSGQEVSRANVSMWQQRGIPSRFQPLLSEIAAEQGVKLPSGFVICVRTEVAA